MSSITRPSRFTRPRRRPGRSSVVRPPRFARLRLHPGRSAAGLAALLAALAVALPAGYSWAFPPALDCGPGMIIAGSPHSCVGVSLGFGQFTKNDPPKLRGLERRVQGIDDKVHGQYVSVVLLLDLSPVPGIDTVTYSALYPNIEGAVTAALEADHTSDFDTTPQVKLFLGNMGSEYGSWRKAVQQIAANRVAQHITSVVGLGQSTTPTRRAAALLSSRVHLPVIGATVTGDSMNLDPVTHRRIVTFFRVSPPNSMEVRAIAQYVSTRLRPKPPSAVVVEDTPGDDYESTLATATPGALRAAGVRVDMPLLYFSGGKPAGETRETYLGNPFDHMQSNLCRLDPSLVFFAGRGQDLDAFVNSWVDEKGCQQAGAPPLPIFSGDDASAVVKDKIVLNAIKDRRITLTYTTLANTGMWGNTCSGARKNYDQFLADFTGKNAPCAAVPIRQSADFSAAELDNGQAVPTHDAVAAAVKAAREAQGTVQGQVEAVSNPKSQLNPLLEFTCATMLGGAGGYVSFGSGGDHGELGEPVDRPVPIVRLNGDGSVTFVDLTWPDGGPMLSLPGKGCGPTG
jgi:hypothetical protein